MIDGMYENAEHKKLMSILAQNGILIERGFITVEHIQELQQEQ